MADQLRLRVVLDMAERVLAPMKRITGASGETARALKAARDRLKQLNEQQAAVGNVQKHAAELARLNNALKVKQALLEGMRASGTATAAQIKREENGVRSLTNALDVQRAAALKSRAALNAMGVTGNLGAAQARLKTEIEGATAAMGRQRAELQRLGDQQRQLQSLRDKHAKTMMHTGMAAGTGYAMYAGGKRAGSAVKDLLLPGNTFDTEMSRVQALTREAADSPALAALRQQARQLGADTMFSATQAAQGQAFLAMAGFTPKAIQGAMPGLLDMAKASNMDLGRGADIASNILSGFDIDPAKMGNVADVLTKVVTTANVNLEMLGNTMSYVAPVARAAGVDLQTTAAMAGLLGNVGIQGEKGGTALRAMLLRLSAPTGKASEALADLRVKTSDADGNMRDLLEVLADIAKATEKMGNAKRMDYMKTIFGEEPAAAMTELIAKAGSGGILKYLEQVRDSHGAAAKTAKIMGDNLTGDWDEISSAWEDVRISIFEANKSEIRSWAQSVVGVIRKVGAWFEANPAASKWLVRLAVVTAVAATVIGALLVPLALVVGKFMLVRFVFAWLARSLFGVRAAAASAGPAVGLLTRVWAAVRPAVMGAGRAIVWVGRALMATPLGRVLSLLAFSASMVYANWQGIKGGLVAIWDGITGRISEAISGGVGAWLALLMDFSPIGILYSVLAFALDSLGIELPARFSDLGGHMMTGLVNGITAGAAWVKDAVLGVASSAASWFAEKLGIASPSRLFMQYGGWISEGAALGIAGGQGAVRTAALSMAAAASATMPMAADAAAMRLDTRAPLSAAATTAPAATGGGNVFNITINAAPGMDERAIGRAVVAEFERRERAGRSRVLSSMHDID